MHDQEKIRCHNPATFQNTVLALETSGVDFNRAVGIFYNLTIEYQSNLASY
jgi:peptidyl-dipeptidase Dcp